MSNDDQLFLENDWPTNAFIWKTRGLELVIYRLPNMFRIFFCLLIHHQIIFGTLTDRGFWIPKIAVGNLCKLFHDIISLYLPTSK